MPTYWKKKDLLEEVSPRYLCLYLSLRSFAAILVSETDELNNSSVLKAQHDPVQIGYAIDTSVLDCTSNSDPHELRNQESL